MVSLETLVTQCQQEMPIAVVRAVINIESSGNPLSVGVVGFHHFFQPDSVLMGANMLQSLNKRGISCSAGLMQINTRNFSQYHLTNFSVFNPCENIRVGTEILFRCYKKSVRKYGNNGLIKNYLNAASCYYSGNFKSGYHLPRNKPYVVRFKESLIKFSNKEKQ